MSQHAERELKHFWDDEEPELLVIGTEKTTAVASLLEQQRKKKINGPKQRADALMLMADRFISFPGAENSSNDFKTADRYQVVVHVDAQTLIEDPEKPQTPFSQKHCELEDGPALAPDTVKRLCCDSCILAMHKDCAGNPLNIGRKTRVIPPAMRRALLTRDKGCLFPGCTTRSTRYLDGHHIKHWADGGETSLENLVCLCRHHHRLIHEGGFDVQRKPDGQLQFLRPDGTEIQTEPPVIEASEQIETLNARNKLHIDKKTVFRQRDPSMDYGVAVDALLRRRVIDSE